MIAEKSRASGALRTKRAPAFSWLASLAADKQDELPLLKSAVGRSQESVRQGVLVLVVKDRLCGLDGIKLERMDRLWNSEDEERKMD